MMSPRSVWKFWRWVFARTYLRHERQWGPEASLWSAITALSINMTFNLLAAAAVFAWALRRPIHITHPREVGVAVIALVLGANYLRFVRYADAAQLIRTLQRGDRELAQRDERKLAVYTVVSFLAPVLIVVARLRFH